MMVVLVFPSDGGCQKNIHDVFLEDLNVVMIMVDTLGIAHTGYYNNQYSHTPNIDKLAQNGVSFTQAYATSSWTKPAIASIFTSYMPSHHKNTQIYDILSQDLCTLAEHFQNKGFKTAGIISHQIIDKQFGFSQGFETYIQMNKCPNSDPHWQITSKSITDESIKWLNNNMGQNNSHFFLFVHYFDPHYAYRHHPQFDLTSQYQGNLTPGMGYHTLMKKRSKFSKEDIDYLVGLYHEEIKYTDFHIGRLLSYMEDRDIAKKTLVLFVADHGEEFMQRGSLGHGQTLYNEVIHVPFIFYLPGILSSHMVELPVSQLDIMPTLLSMSRVPVLDPTWEGISLIPYLKNSKYPSPSRDIFSEVSVAAEGYFSNLCSEKTAVINGKDKLIFDKPTNSWEIYNLGNDPEELKKIPEKKAPRFSELSDKIRTYREGQKAYQESDPASKLKYTPKDLQQLKSLGYIQ